jgi:hypothetical protein
MIPQKVYPDRGKRKPAGTILTPKAEGSNAQPSVDEMQKLVAYKGKEYHGVLAWFG